MTNASITKVGITGAAGNMGKTLTDGLRNMYEFVLYDMKKPYDPKNLPYFVVDFANTETLDGIFNGLGAVIHLAADPSPQAGWESIHRNNIVATYNVFERARRSGVRKIVFASTNHVQHGYTMKTTPETLDTSFYKKGRRIALNDLPNPDSLYAVSKLFGEDLGRHYAREFGIQFVALRIGWTIPEDDPSVLKGTSAEDYMRAMFLSKRDCVQAFAKALEVDTNCLVAYAISNNDKLVFDLSETREMLGFNPVDNAEIYF